MTERPYPICPRCGTHADVTSAYTDGVHLWHFKCRVAWERDREWLTHSEAEGAFE